MKTFLGRDDAHGARDRVPIGEIGPETNMFSLVDTGGIVYELNCLIRSSFSEFKVLFSRRTCNRVAHYVAAFGCKCPRDTLLCWEGMPNGLEDLVANNLAESIS